MRAIKNKRKKSNLFSIANVFTVLAAIMTWCLTYLVNTLPDSPLVELSQTYIRSSDGIQVIASITNLSRAKRLRNLTFGMSSRGKQSGKYSHHALVASAPAAEGNLSRSYTVGNDGAVMFQIGEIHPGQHFAFSARYSGTDLPEIRLVTSEEPVYLLKKGLITCLVRYIIHTLIAVGLFVLFFIAIRWIYIRVAN